MADVKLNPVLEQIRGKVGDLVFRRYEDRTVIAQKPDLSDREPTPAQQAVRDRFKRATLYGRMVMADPAAKAAYEAEADERGQPVFSLTLADFLNAPVIEEVDVSDYRGAVGNPIAITATDDFEVARVEVTLADAGGAVLEEGEAASDGFRWVYTAQTAVAPETPVRIEVRAFDRPGGVGTQTAEATTPA